MLGHALLFAGHFQEAAEPLETAVRIARELDLYAVLSGALIDQGLISLQASRPEEARELLESAVAIAERNELAPQLMLARGNSGCLAMQWDLPGADEDHAQTLALARRHGERFQESLAAGNLAYTYVFAGRWDEVELLAAELLDDFEDRPGAEFLRVPLTLMHTLRGELDEARASLELMDAWAHSDDDEHRAIHVSVAVGVCLAEGRRGEALERGSTMLIEAVDALGPSHDAVRNGWPDIFQAALELGRLDPAGELLALLTDQPPPHVPPYLRAHVERGRALLAAAEGEHDTVEADLTSAVEGFRSISYPYWHARAQVDLVAWLIDREKTDDAAPVLAEARATLASLEAAPALALAADLEASHEPAGRRQHT